MNFNFLSVKFPKNPVFLGKIGTPYGICGWCKVFSFTECITNIIQYKPWFIQKNNKYYFIELENWKYYKKNFILKFKGIDDRDLVKELTNSYILIDYNQLPKLDNNQYYWKDLIDCLVINFNNKNIGKVINLIDNGVHDILIIKPIMNNKLFQKKILIPFINEKFIKYVDLSNKLIKVHWNIK